MRRSAPERCVTLTQIFFFPPNYLGPAAFVLRSLSSSVYFVLLRPLRILQSFSFLSLKSRFTYFGFSTTHFPFIYIFSLHQTLHSFLKIRPNHVNLFSCGATTSILPLMNSFLILSSVVSPLVHLNLLSVWYSFSVPFLYFSFQKNQRKSTLN